MSKTQRLFFALWPDDKTRQSLFRIARQCVPDKARAVDVNNLHATLVFLGNQPESLLPGIRDAASQLSLVAFQLELDHLEIWKRSQVMSLCPAHTPKALSTLHESLNLQLETVGIETESRPYRPHVTLARKVRKKLTLPDISPLTWDVSEFALIASIAEEHGVRYQVRDRWQLS